ncbi:hypothetical protein H4R18_005604 [Coemansia javaensis]|uniref:Major facilitator superfamily (MFS) profile domain-containing protein n=1 Tax=Coemansia javaensis TaxID=2761396 RepID=A0A9W8H8L6_9FUNG|nr:hypothetical protein H4R18_005604 [Coemansia javaensis]
MARASLPAGSQGTPQSESTITLSNASRPRLKDVEGGASSASIPGTETETETEPDVEAGAEQPRQLLSGARLAMAIISLDILMFIAALDSTIVATTYIPIGDKLGALGSAEWIITSYLIAVTAFQPLYGSISDLLGRVEAIVFAVLVFLFGSVLCAVSGSMPMLIASRAVQGVGGAGLISLALIVIADIMNERQRGKYVGIFTGTYGLGTAVAPVIGGAIVQNTKWQVIFWINIPFCVVALAMIVLLLRIPRPQGALREKLARIDFGGALLSVAGVVLLLLGLAWGGRERAWGSAAVVCTLVAGLAALGLFALYEWRVPRAPIMPLRLFRARNVAVACACSLLFGFAINGAIMFIPQWAQIVKQATPLVSGAYIVSASVGMIATSIVSGVLLSRFGRCREIIIVGAGLTLLGNGLLIDLGSGGSVAKVVGYLLVTGLGVGACVQTITLIGQASVSGKDMAAATATILFFRSLGMVLSISVLTNVIQNVLRGKIAAIVGRFPDQAGAIAAALEDQSRLYSSGIPAQVVQQFIAAYSDALRAGFVALAAFTGVYFALTLGFKHVSLRTVLKKTIDA